jgi:hypothetical protein
MAELKTKPTKQNVKEFLDQIEPAQKRDDGFVLLKLFKSATHERPTMWGPSIIGFGKYHYKSERSTQEGDWLIVGFSPRKQSISLYIMSAIDNNDPLLKKLGKYKASVGCLYINKLLDIDLGVLAKLVEKAYKLKKKNT